MKAKLLMFLGILFFTLPINGFTTNKHPRHLRIQKSHINIKATTRVPIDYTIDITGDETNLQILFPFSLQDADITVTDKNGNTVINEQQASIYEGKTLYIYGADGYPYSIEITSPTVEITGEIVLEEN